MPHEAESCRELPKIPEVIFTKIKMENEENKQEEAGQTAFNLMFKRALEHAGGDKDKAELAIQLAEEQNLTDYVKQLNTEMANTYQDVMNSWPTVKELDLIINMDNPHVDAELEFNAYWNSLDEKRKQERKTALLRFRTALVMIEKDDIRIKPKRYEDPDEVQEKNE